MTTLLSCQGESEKKPRALKLRAFREKRLLLATGGHCLLAFDHGGHSLLAIALINDALDLSEEARILHGFSHVFQDRLKFCEEEHHLSAPIQKQISVDGALQHE